MRGELCRVDKNRNDRVVILAQRGIDQLQVAFVQRAHRRHKADRFAFVHDRLPPHAVRRHTLEHAHRRRGPVGRHAI